MRNRYANVRKRRFSVLSGENGRECSGIRKRRKMEISFKRKAKQDFGISALQTVINRETGVRYLVTVDAAVSGVTPMPDKNGKA